LKGGPIGPSCPDDGGGGDSGGGGTPTPEPTCDFNPNNYKYCRYVGQMYTEQPPPPYDSGDNSGYYKGRYTDSSNGSIVTDWFEQTSDDGYLIIGGWFAATLAAGGGTYAEFESVYLTGDERCSTKGSFESLFRITTHTPTVNFYNNLSSSGDPYTCGDPDITNGVPWRARITCTTSGASTYGSDIFWGGGIYAKGYSGNGLNIPPYSQFTSTPAIAVGLSSRLISDDDTQRTAYIEGRWEFKNDTGPIVTWLGTDSDGNYIECP